MPSTFLKRHWFLAGITAMIAAGMVLGVRGHAAAVRPLADLIGPQITTACVLFLMAFSLESEHLWAAIRAPKPVCIGFVVNFGVVPLETSA